MHGSVPTAFPAVMLIFYMLVSLAQLVFHVLQKPSLLFIIAAVQYVLVLIVGLAVLVDDWCMFFAYRGVTHAK